MIVKTITVVNLNTKNHMNKHDRDNLAYILTLSGQGPAALEKWLEDLPMEDAEYALELLKEYTEGMKNLLSYVE